MLLYYPDVRCRRFVTRKHIFFVTFFSPTYGCPFPLVLQYDAFCLSVCAFLQDKRAHFAAQNVPFRNLLAAKALRRCRKGSVYWLILSFIFCT